MVQSYGATSSQGQGRGDGEVEGVDFIERREDDAVEGTGETEVSALLTDGIRPDGEVYDGLLGKGKGKKLREGHATLVSCVSNLANTIIGSGAYGYDCISLTLLL